MASIPEAETAVNNKERQVRANKYRHLSNEEADYCEFREGFLRCVAIGLKAVCDEFIFIYGEPGDEREQLKRRLCDSVDRHWSDFEHLRDLRRQFEEDGD